MMFFAMALLHNLDNFVISSSNKVNLYLELEKTSDMNTIIKELKESHVDITDLEIKKAGLVNDKGPALLINFNLPKKQSRSETLDKLTTLDGVLFAEIL